MKPWNVLIAITLLMSLFFAGAVDAEQIYLWADFNNKTPDQPIGTGGASVGEPVAVQTEGISATVRTGPMESPSLEIQDASSDDGGPSFARFDLLGGAELASGTVVVAADLWFETVADAADCTLRIYEQGTTEQHRFGELVFTAAGSVYFHYGDASSAGEIGQVAAGRRYRVILAFDMDTRTVDIWLDGSRVVQGLALGVTEEGIGSIFVGAPGDPDESGRFYIDALTVTDYLLVVPTEDATWGRIRAVYR